MPASNSKEEQPASTRYEVLFRVECLHEYFGGACPSLTVSPTEDCRKLMERYHMLFRGSASGGALLAPLTAGALPQFDEVRPFTFRLISTEPMLDLYTDFGPEKLPSAAESLFYFDNTADQPAEIFGAPRQLLHSSKQPFQGAGLEVRPKLSSYLLPEDLPGGNLQVIEPLTKQVLWQRTVERPNAPVPLDLRGLAEGCYLLKLDDRELSRFYLSNVPPVQSWGAISIYAGGPGQAGALPENCRVLDQDGRARHDPDNRPKTFTLALGSRKIFWRYYIIDSAGKQDFGEHQIMLTPRKPAASGSPDANIVFHRLPETMPIDGRTAWIFESKEPLPLLQSPATEFSLALRANGNGKRTFRLPFAQPSSFRFKEETRSLCSEVFVYV